MIVAAIEILSNKYDFNYASNLFVDATDIDKRCVHMTYLQLAMLGVPAVIRHGDTLSLDIWDTWFTPSYLMQYPKFIKYFKPYKNVRELYKEYNNENKR